MHKLRATFQTTTPTFIAGANQSVSELRLPSIKGALRFWWRALMYGGSQVSGDVKKLAKLEAKLFGDINGQARVRLHLSRVKEKECRKSGEIHPDLAQLPGARYLGYGVVHAFDSRQSGVKKGELTRGCADCSFDLNCVSRSPIPEDFVCAVKALGLFGGVGSKARKGYGSLVLKTLELDGKQVWQSPKDLSQFEKDLATVIGESGQFSQRPEISAFSSHARIDFLQQGNDALELLDFFGRQLQRYRSWGQTERGNLVNGQPSEKRFKDDHDWSKGNAPSSNFHPRRVVFGLPHNYGKKASQKVEPENHERRASPLTYHVHDFGNGTFAGISVILRSQFLPEGERISAGGKKVPVNVDYSVLTEFLEARVRETPGTDSDQLYFPERRKLWPLEDAK